MDDKRTVALLANPAARGGAHAKDADRAAERLRSHGIRVVVVSGGSANQSRYLLQEAVDQGVDAVAVAGGDGTVHLAIQTLAEAGIPLGIIPVGTGNDLAAALGLQALDAAEAADAIAAGRTRRIDLPRVTRADGTTESFATVLASGFDARVSDRANRMRWPKGSARYTVALLRELVRLRPERFEIEVIGADGEVERLNEDLLMATVGNSSTYGGGIRVCPSADMSDGLLDVTLVRAMGRIGTLRFLPSVYGGTHATHEKVRMLRAKAITLRARAVPVFADGDPLATLPITIELQPAALEVFVP